MQKTTEFENNTGEKLGVAYLILNGTHCVFTAKDDACKGSSVNYAEEIISAICTGEQIDPFSMRFFDLQTRTSYGSGLWRTEPGDFEFDEVLIVSSSGRVQGFRAESWRLTKCPEQVTAAFAALIDGTPRQATPRAFEGEFYQPAT